MTKPPQDAAPLGVAPSWPALLSRTEAETRVASDTGDAPVGESRPMAKGTWLFSRNVDLAVFLGSAVVSFGALGIGAITGDLHQDTPGWAWVPAIVLCDVAHVWSTVLRTYLDPAERRTRPALLVLVPVLGFFVATALYSTGELVFWRALAYLAIFHFVRQQYGWVSLYRSRGGEVGLVGKTLDTCAIYAATLWPLFYWHTHLPRRISWLFPGDIRALPAALMPLATTLYVAALAAYGLRATYLWWRGTPAVGKDIVVLTTAAAWYVGIVAFDSDYAFTVTNVFMHGIPYFAIVILHARARSDAQTPTVAGRLARNVGLCLCLLWLIAFFEELVWDRAVWQERAWLFGEGWNLPRAWKSVMVPLLALPQLTHYVLDGVVWRRKTNPSVAALVRPTR